MIQRPQLPDTDDPSELLGVSQQPTLYEVMAARDVLLRSFRPDRAPLEYQRIQAAFEYWRDVLRLPEFRQPPRQSRERQPSRSVARAGVAQVWPEPAPDLATPHVAEFRTRQQAGAAPQELAEWWLRGLRDGLELVESIFYCSTPEVLQQLSHSDELSWSTLGMRRIRWRGRLWQLYAIARLERGDWPLLLEQIYSLEFRLAVKGDQTLREAAWQVLSVAAWEMPESSFDDLAWLGTPEPKGAGAPTFLEIRALRGELQRCSTSSNAPASFGPFVRCARVNEGMRLRALRDIGNAWSGEAEAWWKLCDKLARHAPALARYLLDSLRLDEWTHDLNVNQLSAARQRSLEDVLQRAKQRQVSLGVRLIDVLASLLSMAALAWVILTLSARGIEPRAANGAPGWVLVVTLGSVAAMGAFKKFSKEHASVGYLRRELLQLGFGYPQLLSARAFVSAPVPKDLARHPGLELYLTFGRAATNALAQPEPANRGSGARP